VVILWDLSADATFQVTREGCAGRREGSGDDVRSSADGGLTMRQLLLTLLGRIRRGRRHVLGSGVSLIGLSLVLAGCASHSLMPAAQSAAIRERERALASHADAIQSTVRPSGKVGGLAFLDAKDGHLVVLPGDSPADAWAQYTSSPESETSPVSMPPVVTFVYRTDIAKAPEAVTRSDLQQQRTSAAALATELRRIEERLGLVQRELAGTKQDTDKALADMRALAEDLATVRKFMMQTAQLGWLNHELVVENANGMRKMAATSQELTASSAKLEDTLRQLSENITGQLKELATRLDSIQGKIQNLK
jgi:DNA repair exonuclease SbcCD ATPase subunit